MPTLWQRSIEPERLLRNWSCHTSSCRCWTPSCEWIRLKMLHVLNTLHYQCICDSIGNVHTKCLWWSGLYCQSVKDFLGLQMTKCNSISCQWSWLHCLLYLLEKVCFLPFCLTNIMYDVISEKKILNNVKSPNYLGMTVCNYFNRVHKCCKHRHTATIFWQNVWLDPVKKNVVFIWWFHQN